MSDIEQLRADIEKLENAMSIATRLKADVSYHNLKGLKRELQDQLAKLEAEEAAKADPWREHKEVLSGRFHTQQGADHDEKLVLNYAMHLQQTNEKMALKSRLDNARIAELEAELARTKEAHETVGEAYDCKREDNKDLRRTVKELEAELANRPVADPEPTKWGGKADGKWVVDGFGKPLRFYSREAAKYVFTDAVEIVPYTGEQS